MGETTTTKTHSIRIGFVDSSYWDEGNRSTSVRFSFPTRHARDVAFRTYLKTKMVHTAGQEGPKQDFSINWIEKVDIVETTRSYEVER